MKIPEWANYIATDPDGDVMAFERAPNWSKADGWLSGCRYEIIGHVDPPEDPYHTKKKIFKLSQFKNLNNGTEEQRRSAL